MLATPLHVSDVTNALSFILFYFIFLFAEQLLTAAAVSVIH
jgi:hypothetical protein